MVSAGRVVFVRGEHLDKKQFRLAVCYPWSLEFVATRFADTTNNLDRPSNCITRFFRGRGWCAARRHNHAMEQALQWKADLICFIGADQSYWTEDMLARLVAHHMTGHDMITALVPTRGYVGGQGTKPFQPIVWKFREDGRGNTIAPRHPHDVHIVTSDDGDIVRADGCGTGVLLFPAEALKSLRPPWFIETPIGPYFERASCTDWPFVNRLQREADMGLWCDTTVLVKHLQTFEIDESFQERFADWEQDGVGDKSTCEYKSPMRIDGIVDQVRVSPSIPMYDARLCARYGLKTYTRADQPAFFFGCYTREDLSAIQSHQSTAILIWTGGDALAMRKALEGTGKHPFGPNVRHVAISQFIADDLDALGLKYVRLPFCCVDESKFKPTPRGKKVYCYCPDHDRNKYGGPLLDEIMKRLPDVEFHVQRTLDPSADMASIYARCGVGLRLTSHDGLSNTVLEMGLCGRAVLWNGHGPNTVEYSDAAHAVFVIERMLESKIPEEKISADTRDFLKMPPDWNQVSYYMPAAPQNGHAPQGIIPPSVAGQPYQYAKYFDARYEGGPLGAGGPDPAGKEASWTRDTIARLLSDNDCASVLDVGCGSMARWDSLPGPNYTGLDISQNALQHARLRFPDGTFSFADVATDDLRYHKSDAVISIDMCQHIKPEDFQTVIERLFAAARKLVVIKTSVGINNLTYQFNHTGWDDFTPEGWSRAVIRVPESPCGAMFIFEKTNKPQSDGEVADPTGEGAREAARLPARSLHILEKQ